MHHQISLCYHPTTVVFVDDNLDYINSIHLQFKKIFHCKAFVEPLEALDYFKSQYQIKPFTQRCFLNLVDEQADHLHYSVNLREIRKEIKIAERFEEVAVVVIDYTMPGMNGLELSEQLKSINPAIRILLLTGEADHDLAVAAFNKGIIDKFIKKGTPELIKTLTQAIKELEYKYFISLSQLIIDKMNETSDRLKCLRNINFANFFNKLCQDKHITEYYLIDEHGSFLMLNGGGQPSCLAVISDIDLTDLTSFAKDDENTPADVIDALIKREKIPFFYSEEDLQTKPSNWGKYFYPAHKINDNNIYYYSYIDNPNAYHFEADKILSYEKYLENL